MSLQPEQLIKTDVFGQLNDLERRELIQLSRKRHFIRGETLCYQDDSWPFVVFIASGRLRSTIVHPDGRNFINSTWPTGEVFWGHTIFDQLPMPSTLEAVCASTLYQWNGEEALEIVLRNPVAVRALLSRTISLIRQRRENIYGLVFNPVVSRLAKLIVEQFDIGENPIVQRELTLEEMAGMIATSPVVVCRLLYQLQSEGILTIKRATFTLNDRAALEKLVEQERIFEKF